MAAVQRNLLQGSMRGVQPESPGNRGRLHPGRGSRGPHPPRLPRTLSQLWGFPRSGFFQVLHAEVPPEEGVDFHGFLEIRGPLRLGDLLFLGFLLLRFVLFSLLGFR